MVFPSRRGEVCVGDERAAGDVDRKLGERVRARRLEIGMSQERLADLLGVTFQQVQKYERGVNRIAASRLFDIATVLEVPIGRLFDGLGRGGARASDLDTVSDALTTPGAVDLLRAYVAIRNPKLRRRLMELVRAMEEDGA